MESALIGTPLTLVGGCEGAKNTKSLNIKDTNQHSGDLLLHFPRHLRQTEELTT